jgi:hypothetical protein
MLRFLTMILVMKEVGTKFAELTAAMKMDFVGPGGEGGDEFLFTDQSMLCLIARWSDGFCLEFEKKGHKIDEVSHTIPGVPLSIGALMLKARKLAVLFKDPKVDLEFIARALLGLAPADELLPDNVFERLLLHLFTPREKGFILALMHFSSQRLLEQYRQFWLSVAEREQAINSGATKSDIHTVMSKCQLIFEEGRYKAQHNEGDTLSASLVDFMSIPFLKTTFEEKSMKYCTMLS